MPAYSVTANQHRSRSAGPLFLMAGAMVALLFALRQIPLTSDDQFYLDYFAGYREFGDSLLLTILDEPIFKSYTNLLYSVFTPETNVRLLILLTILPHLVIAYRLGGWRCWAYFSGYFLFVELAPHLSWVQLRQGFALGLLALYFHFGKERFRAAGMAVAGLVHTSMLVLLPCFAVTAIRSRRLAYGIMATLALVLLLFPNLADQLGFLLGRRENVYLDEAPTYSVFYVLYCVVVAAYVTAFTRDSAGSTRILVYHAMCALVLPMFFMSTLGAVAERLYFVVRWYELTIVTRNTRPDAARIAGGYLAMNLAYFVYHSIVYSGNGGAFDRYMQLISP